MPFVTTKDGTQIFYKDWGPKDAQPLMFHHGWPLSADDAIQIGQRLIAWADTVDIQEPPPRRPPKQ